MNGDDRRTIKRNAKTLVNTVIVKVELMQKIKEHEQRDFDGFFFFPFHNSMDNNHSMHFRFVFMSLIDV